MIFLLLLPLIVGLAAFTAFPMNWMLMLAAGNFGFAEFGFWDLLPASLFVAMAFGCGRASVNRD